jgi:hypothetical protein
MAVGGIAGNYYSSRRQDPDRSDREDEGCRLIPGGRACGSDYHHDPFGIIDLLNLKVVIHMAVDKAAVDVWIGLWMSVENLWAAA